MVVRTVLKKDNVVEALSICDATPGRFAAGQGGDLEPERGREGCGKALEEAGSIEVPRLEEKLNVLRRSRRWRRLLGLLGTVLGFIDIFQAMEKSGGSRISGR